MSSKEKVKDRLMLLRARRIYYEIGEALSLSLSVSFFPSSNAFLQLLLYYALRLEASITSHDHEKASHRNKKKRVKPESRDRRSAQMEMLP